jgi:uncharacterized protein (DUF697 family)
MHKSKGARTDSRSYRMLIHGYAITAAGSMAASVALPAPLGALADSLGLDPVDRIQRQMLEKLCALSGCDLGIATASIIRDARRTSRATRQTSCLASKALVAATRRFASRAAGRKVARAVPIAGVAVSASIAYYETWNIGRRCIQFIQKQLGS